MDIKITQVRAEIDLLQSEDEILAINNKYHVEAKISNHIYIEHKTYSDNIDTIKREIKQNLSEALKGCLDE